MLADRARQAQILDEATQTLIAAMPVAPSGARTALIDTLVVALKDAGIWTKLDMLHVMAAHDVGAALINWVNPGTHNLTRFNSCTFTTDSGFSGNGSSMYVSPGVGQTGLTNYTQNDAHVGMWVTAGNNADNQLGTLRTGTSGTFLVLRAAGTCYYNINSWAGGNTTFTQANNTGHLVAVRTSSTAIEAFVNGSSGSTGLKTSDATDTDNFSILRTNAAIYSSSSTRIGISHWGASLSSGEVSSLYTALNAYMTGL